MDGLVSDPIPNIRFNVAKSYAVLIDTLRRVPEKGTIADGGDESKGSAKGQELITSQIMPNLEKLQTDDDADVRYFATTAAGGKPGVQDSGEQMDTEQ
jgi:serine/threonine-protein phosphatase 2A regulatory subunit A